MRSSTPVTQTTTTANREENNDSRQMQKERHVNSFLVMSASNTKSVTVPSVLSDAWFGVWLFVERLKTASETDGLTDTAESVGPRGALESETVIIVALTVVNPTSL